MIGARTCLITGVTSGLGAYASAAFASRGWIVIGTGRKPEGNQAIPDGITYIQADLASRDAPAEIAAQVPRRPNLILHCAVIYPSADTELENLFQVNTFAPVRLTRELLARPSEAEPCCVVMVNSEVMSNADEHSGPYAASKAALRVMTTALAHEVRGSNVAVATLLLGPLANESKREELANIAKKKGVDPKAVTKLFLRKSNPNLVIDDLLGFAECVSCIETIQKLGLAANGMVCRLDGGAGGSLT